MIRDRIVCGVRDSSLRKNLPQVPELTLERCIDMCRSAEARSQHTHPPSEVNSVKKLSKEADKSSFVKDCRIGGQAHEKEKSKCLAFGTICSACQKENHFGLKCMCPLPKKAAQDKETKAQETST